MSVVSGSLGIARGEDEILCSVFNVRTGRSTGEACS